jgi:hypothetical protein
MSCAKPFVISANPGGLDFFRNAKTTLSERTESYAGLTSPAVYTEVSWPTCWEVWDADCWAHEEVKVFPAVTWIPSSDITYGIGFKSTIDCHGSLISPGGKAGLGFIASWIIQNLTLTCYGNFAGDPFRLFENTLIDKQIKFSVQEYNDKVSIYAEQQLYGTSTSGNYGIFTVRFAINFDLLVCVVPSMVLKLKIATNLSISDALGKAVSINVNIAIPVETPTEAVASTVETGLISYLEGFLTAFIYDFAINEWVAYEN